VKPSIFAPAAQTLADDAHRNRHGNAAIAAARRFAMSSIDYVPDLRRSGRPAQAERVLSSSRKAMPKR
jgi:hypothetical protein